MSEVVANTQNLYSILERGDRRIASAFSKAIILVGLTRVGKSTVYNWILDKQMIGAGTKIRPYYTNVIAHDADQAQIKESIISVTLCPNINQYKKEEQISLIDMAGFMDKRNYVGVYGVSYFLKSVFQKVNQAKFVLVIDEQNLKLSSGEGIMKTFSGFLNMFNLDLIRKDPVTKKQFYQSISLCITKSQKPELHQDYLIDICEQMKNQSLVADKKQEMIELIEYLLNTSNFIQEFKKARYNDYAEKCTMIERFDKLKWDYFGIQQRFIQLPFQKQFDNLPENQQNQFLKIIQKRILSFLQFSKILKQLIKSVNSRWASIIYDWNQTRTLNLKFTYEDMFSQIQEFLAGNDFYNSQQLIKQQFRIDYNELNLVKVIKTILELYRMNQQVTQVAQVTQIDFTFKQKMVKYSHLFVQICENLRLFCLNKEEQNLIQRLKFVIERGFKEFSKLHQIKQYLVVEVNQYMKDNFCGLFEEMQYTFIERYVKEINYPILGLMYDKIQGLQQYEEFFGKFETQYSRGHINCTFTDFKRHRKNIDLCKANIYDRNQEKKLALKCYLKVLKILGQIRNDIKAGDKSPEEMTNQLNQLFMQKLITIGFSTNILKKLPGVPGAKNYALNLCINVNNIDQVCEIYQMIINQAGSNAKKIQIYNDYIEYCIKWGRLQDANVLLQRKLGLEKQSFANYKQTIEKLIEVAKNIKKNTLYIDSYIQNLQSLFSKVDEKDESLDDYLNEIEAIIK